MRRFSGVLFLASFGLVSGCGDNGNDTQGATGNMMTTTLPPLTTTDPGTSTSTATETTAPTTTDGTGTATESTTAPTTTDGTATSTTEPVDTTAGPTTEPQTSTTMMTTMPGTTGDTPCQEISVTVQPIKPNTMLVLDKSGSMLQTWDADADPNTPNVTRWYSLYAVVNQVLTDFNDKFNFGMNLFPSKNALGEYKMTACLVNDQVEVPVAELNKDAIIPVLPAQSNMTIAGGTPTALGMTAALNHLKSLDPAVPRIVMLVTDGAANCSTSAANLTELFEVYDENVAPIISDAYTVDNIPTYVIGIAIDNAPNPNIQDGNPNTINPYEKLNELATLGGTAKAGNEKFYSANNAIELSDALNAIVQDAQSCIIPLESPPAFPDKTIVKLGNNEIPMITDCANESGWRYIEPMPYMALELCGTACADLKIAGEADVEYYCDAG
ncbi:von Willebrand factor type A domain-containing protein [Nannocystis exedens]|uniref:von Willebrand factor type A domain-containing protein n=1 Tax=Nannocystis exedens TaxID=54 RepID=A0A1I1V5E0_9BACT|nr:vWA domain-containing protein [Nannocystis exedens]PCC72353.1 von Willebrand factor type A domain protein [Nannocystis exedens]SFD78114.1 von Willebrand factor type A domain-containing protein [Nannocystis exedens]